MWVSGYPALVDAIRRFYQNLGAEIAAPKTNNVNERGLGFTDLINKTMAMRQGAREIVIISMQMHLIIPISLQHWPGAILHHNRHSAVDGKIQMQWAVCELSEPRNTRN